MTTLITGGAGFIGTRLTQALTRAGHRVVVFDSLHPQVHGEGAPDPVLPAGAEFVRGDVCDAAALSAVVAGVRPTTVYHLAAETGTGQSLTQSHRHASVNVLGTATLMDALSGHEVVPERFILTSSRAVYGEGAWRDGDSQVYPAQRLAGDLDAGRWLPPMPSGHDGEPLPHRADAVEPRPTNVYAGTKLAQEHLLSAWTGSFGSRLATLRLQNVYGAGQALGNPYTGVLTYLTTQALAGHVLHVFEGGGIIRDFVHVSDVVAALVAALDAPLNAGATRTVDIGSGEPATLESAARTLVDIAGSGSVEITGEYRLGDVRAAYADNSAAADWLGYRPTTAFASGAAELVGWARVERDAAQRRGQTA